MTDLVNTIILGSDDSEMEEEKGGEGNRSCIEKEDIATKGNIIHDQSLVFSMWERNTYCKCLTIPIMWILINLIDSDTSPVREDSDLDTDDDLERIDPEIEEFVKNQMPHLQSIPDVSDNERLQASVVLSRSEFREIMRILLWSDISRVRSSCYKIICYSSSSSRFP